MVLSYFMMILTSSKKIFGKKLQVKRYHNGQLALSVHDEDGQPLAELSIMDNSVGLRSNEFILKDYSENEGLIQEYIQSNIITSSDRFVLIGPRLCPICQLVSDV